MTAIHRIVGYDRSTERLAVAYDIPSGRLDSVKRIADVDQDDPDAIYSYALAPAQVCEIARLIGRKVAPHDYDFFLEPFDD